ncbi:MAG TPA: glycerate kinase, partial [Myxococcaceae bacterium]|nr:glycerate kinase [Myxococcaceae bacterium]
MRSDIHLRILVAPQELKGTLTASEAAEVLADALRDTVPRAELDVAPMADGGPGTVEALVRAGAGQIRTRRVTGPLGGPVEARWGVLDSGRTAVVEMAAASGLSLLAPEALDPERATSFGSGELIRAALDEGCRRIIVGLGGSATNDGGAGAVTALGIQLLDRCGAPLHPGGAELLGLERIELSGRDPRLEQTELQLATDVINPLLGPNGASAVYGPQKVADADTVAL